MSFADSWKLAALVETFGGSSGVGYQIGRSYHLFSVRDVLAWMCFFVIFVVLLERLVLVNAERRLFGGEPKRRNEAGDGWAVAEPRRQTRRTASPPVTLCAMPPICGGVRGQRGRRGHGGTSP